MTGNTKRVAIEYRRHIGPVFSYRGKPDAMAVRDGRGVSFVTDDDGWLREPVEARGERKRVGAYVAEAKDASLTDCGREFTSRSMTSIASPVGPASTNIVRSESLPAADPT